MNKIKKLLLPLIIAVTSAAAYATTYTCVTHTECHGGRCATVTFCRPA